MSDLRTTFVNSDNSGQGLSVLVEFAFDESGRLHEIRIVRASGDLAFDRAADAAFQCVRAHGLPLDAVGKSYRVTFRTAG